MSSTPRQYPHPQYPAAPGRAGSPPGGGPGGGPVRRGIPDGAIVGLLGTLLGTTTLVWLSTALGGLVTHGHLPHPLPFGGTPVAIRHLATAPNDLPGAWPGTAPAQLPSPTAFWSTFFVLLAMLIALALTILTAWSRLRVAKAHGRAREESRSEDGHSLRHPREHDDAAGTDVTRAPEDAPGTDAAEPDLPPSAERGPLPVPRAADSAPAASAPQASARFAFPAGTTCLLAPDPAAAAAKRQLLQQAVDTAAGPVVVVTDDPTLWETRPAHRDARLYDPLRLVDALADSDQDVRVRWAPHSRCEDPTVATSRARALLAPTARSGTSQGEKSIQETAQTLLRCWLHAAALDARPFRHVQRWAQGTARQEAAAILRSADPHTTADGWGGELQALLTHATDLRDAALERILAALDALSELQVLQTCTPSPANSGLDVESLVRNRGTLYLMGRATESRVSRPDDSDARASAAPARRSAMPLLAALVEDVVEHGRRMAVRSSSGRLDPPLLCVLDSVAAVAPFPGLPELMARGGPLGLHAIAVFRSPEQVRSRWGDRAVHSLWTNSDARALLGPAPEAEVRGLLGALQPDAAAAGTGALSSEDLLLLTGRQPAQRFRIVISPPADTPVRSVGRSTRR